MVPVCVFALLCVARIWGITHEFALLPSHIRDWSIALGSLLDLPLGGTPGQDGGHTLGPAFYWILWIFRVVVGPWFDNLPHAAAIGQAMLQSAADALLLTAIWRRSGSWWMALATVGVTVAVSYDLFRSTIPWNSMMAFALAEIATALVLFGTPIRSGTSVAATVAIAWCALQCSTEAIFTTAAVLSVLFAWPRVEHNESMLRRNVWIAAMVAALLQIPHAVHKTVLAVANNASNEPSSTSTFVGQAVLCLWVFLALAPLASKSRLRVTAAALLVTALILAPTTWRTARRHGRTAEYSIIVDGARKMARRTQPLRAIRIAFPAPPANSAEFLYTILGGRIDPASPWVGVITTNGDVSYESVIPAQ
jgi:hypothetical protein